MGQLDVNQMLDSMTWAQFCGWMAFYKLEPWGSLVEDQRAGNIASAVWNTSRVKKSSKLWSWLDFITGQKVDRDKSGKSKPMTADGWKRFKSSLLMGKKSKKTAANYPTSSDINPS